MLRSNSKSPGNHVASPEEEKERLQWEGFAQKEGFKHKMKELVGDKKLSIPPPLIPKKLTIPPNGCRNYGL